MYLRVPRFGHDFMAEDEDGGIPQCIFDLHNLVKLDLSHHAIRFVPKHIGKLRSLKSLSLQANLLLESLPGELGMLQQLNRTEFSRFSELSFRF